MEKVHETMETQVPADWKRQIKIICIDDKNMTMRLFVRQAIKEKLERMSK